MHQQLTAQGLCLEILFQTLIWDPPLKIRILESTALESPALDWAVTSFFGSHPVMQKFVCCVLLGQNNGEKNTWDLVENYVEKKSGHLSLKWLSSEF